MDLILWRHAEAEDAAPGGSDLDRALTPRGQRQAARVAAWLAPQLPAGTRIVASPARRTQQTVAALEHGFESVDALAPGATMHELLAAVGWPDAKSPVLVVGHQPTLGLAVAWLLTGSVQPQRVRKGAVWWLRARVGRGDGDAQALLVAARAPDEL